MTDLQRLISAYDAVSAFIEKHTQSVCPNCEKVCCIDRHGTYEEEDLNFLRAVGEKPHDVMPKEKDTKPCRFLAADGCTLPRLRRPFRCTWYFCSPLLEAMPGDDPKEYRRFVDSLNRLIELRGDVLKYTVSGRSAAW